MSRLVFNRDGGKTDELGHLLGLSRFIQGEVNDGLQVTANGTPNMSVNVGFGTAAIPTGTAAGAYRYYVGIDAIENVAIPTANGSNPRNDIIVLYVDKAVVPNTTVTNNSNNMLKLMVVSGAAAATPADPSAATIQAAVGAANPYIILARVRTGTGVTQITSGNITDLRSLTGPSRLLVNQVTESIISDSSVTTNKIANLNVTTGKVADLAINNAKIAAGLTANKLSNPYKFSAYRNAAWTPGGTGDNTIPFDTEIYDTNNNFDATTFKYTAPVTGFYQFNGRISLTANTRIFLHLYKNAAVGVARGQDYSHDTQGASSNLSALVPLTAGDTVYLNVYVAAVGGVEVGIDKTYFSGHLVSGT